MLKSASLFHNADDPQPTKNVPKQKDLSRTEQRYFGRIAIKVSTIDTRLDPLIASRITTQYLACKLQ